MILDCFEIAIIANDIEHWKQYWVCRFSQQIIFNPVTIRLFFFVYLTELFIGGCNPVNCEWLVFIHLWGYWIQYGGISLGKLITKDINTPFQEGFREDYYNGIPKTKNIDHKNYHYRFRLDLQYYPRYLECLVLINLYFKFKTNVFESKNWQIIFMIIDFLLNIVFLILKLINPKYINFLFGKLKQNAPKLFVKLIKSNLFLHKLAKKIKNRL